MPTLGLPDTVANRALGSIASGDLIAGWRASNGDQATFTAAAFSHVNTSGFYRSAGNANIGTVGTAFVGDGFASSAGFTNWSIGTSYWDGTQWVTPEFGSNSVSVIIGRSGALLFFTQVSAGAFARNNTDAELLTFLKMTITAGGVVQPGLDNTQTLGTGALRWNTLFAGTGTINTSDERDKTWRGPMNADELRAAKRIIAELGVFQWNASITEKGIEDARLHFGIKAQQAFAIMEDEGLDWTRYAWCCHDEWDDIYQDAPPAPPEDYVPVLLIPAGDRYGVRLDQLALWLIAAQADIQADIEARLAALEAA